jgi:hypothetical protein
MIQQGINNIIHHRLKRSRPIHHPEIEDFEVDRLEGMHNAVLRPSSSQILIR